MHITKADGGHAPLRISQSIPSGPRDLPDETNGGDQPAALRDARDVQVENPVESHDHPEAREDGRVVRRRHPGEAKQPLRIGGGPYPPADVVEPGGGEDGTMKSSARDHRSTAPSIPVLVFHGQPPYGSSSAA